VYGQWRNHPKAILSGPLSQHWIPR
jgi:hypothetical protein